MTDSVYWNPKNETRPRAEGRVGVPFEAVVGFAAGHEDRQLAHVRVERALRDRRVVQFVQRVRDGRVIGRERERPAQHAFGAAARQRVVDLLAALVHVLALQVGKARPGIGIEIGGQFGGGLGGQQASRDEKQQCGPLRVSIGHVRDSTDAKHACYRIPA